MVIINPLPLAPAVGRSYNHITPFTYRDGLTYIEVLETLRAYIRDVLVPHVDVSFDELEDFVITSIDDNVEWTQDKIDDLTTYVNEQVQLIINNSIEVQEPLVVEMLEKDGPVQDAVIDIIDDNLVKDGPVQDAVIDIINGNLVYVLPENFGAIGDGVADDTDAMKEAFEKSEGKEIRLAPGKVYRLTDTIKVSQKGVQVNASGSTVLIDHAADAFQFVGDFSEPIYVSSYTREDDVVNAPSGEAHSVYKFTLVATVPEDWKRGDIIIIASDDVIPGSRFEGDPSSSVQARMGARMTVVSAFDNEVTLAGVMTDDMSTLIRMGKLNSYPVRWTGGLLLYTDSAFIGQKGITFYVKDHLSPAIENVNVPRVKSGALYVESCVNWVATHLRAGYGTNDIPLGAFGYGVLNISSYGGTVSDSFFTQLRTAYTTGSSLTESGTGRLTGFGRAESTTVIACVADSCTGGAGFDTHTQSAYETFINCASRNCARGFSFRGFMSLARDITVVDCSIAVRFIGEGVGGRGIDHVVDGLFADRCNILVRAEMNSNSGSPLYNEREPRPFTVRNVVAKNHRSRLLHLINATMFAENWNIDLADRDWNQSGLIINSDLRVKNFIVTVSNPDNLKESLFAFTGSRPGTGSLVAEDFYVKGNGPNTFKHFIYAGGGTDKFKGRNVVMDNEPSISGEAINYLDPDGIVIF